MPKPRISLVWATTYSGNMGVNALAYSALHVLEQIARDLEVQFSYTLLGTDCFEERTDSIRIGKKEVSFRFFPESHFSSLKGIVKHKGRGIVDADVLVDLGEGDGFSDIYGFRRFRRNISPKIATLFLKKPYLLFPQTIGPFSNRTCRFISNWIMGRIPHVYPRDRLSYDYLKKHYPNRSFREFLDMAFSLPFNPVKSDPTRCNVGINVSGLLWNAGASGSNPFGFQLDYKQLATHLLSRFSNEPNTTVHLISHVVSEIYHHEDDYRVAKKIHADFPKTVLVPPFRSPLDAKSYISGMDFFVGSRMHACIAAYSSAVPVFPIAYSRKFNGLFQQSLAYPYLGDPTKEKEEEILDKLMTCFHERLPVSKDLRVAKDRIQENHSAFVREVSNVFKRFL